MWACWSNLEYMKFLLIDNGTSYLLQLEKLLSGHSFRVIKYFELGSVNPMDFDVVILSGGHSFPVQGNDERLRGEIDLVKNFPRPIFGICFGFEIIAHTFGAKLERMENKEKGILDIKITEQDDLFLNISGFQVFESHRWVVREPGENLIALAISKDGIEVIKHKTKPIYGVQFHPEMFVEKTCGDEIFYNFLRFTEKLCGENSAR